MTSGVLGSVAVHPLRAAAEALERALDNAGTAHAWTMTASELAEVLPRLTRLKARVGELELRALVAADRARVGEAAGFTGTPMWWARATSQTRPAAVAALRLGLALDGAHEPVRAAMAAGVVLPDQARVIVDAVDALPRDLVEPSVIASAEAHLVALAAEHDAKDLRILGRRVLDVVAPEVGEEHERRRLEAEERRAAATASFRMHPDGCGSMVGRFKIPLLAGEILAKHLAAIAAPRRNPGAASVVARPLRLGQAFVEYLETRGVAGTPKAGGVAATVVVTMTLADLLGAERAATLDTGERISATEARRLACEAGIIPAVLGSPGQVLDVGRRSRFHTEPQRVALALRDGGCAAEHCDWPPGTCHAHHPTPWSKGGGTSVTNGVLLCPRHHTLAHDARYTQTRSPAGKVRFTRRT